VEFGGGGGQKAGPLNKTYIYFAVEE